MSDQSEYTVVITGGKKHYHRIRRLVHFATLQQGIEEQEADIIERAVAEACHNALYHKPAAPEDPSFELELRLSDTAIVAVVRNRGEAFDFSGVKPFSIEHNFMEYKEGGLGIPIMKRLMDEVHYERETNELNVVTLIKFIDGQPREE
ncbi:MAG: ATP-binding protein [Candidatus Marinimicrobia bacterium]|nr:ATP-binding protein [Candidatus Neomarinimicrobiota bacterium]MCF7830322.1 ATP-binding protein [Candidatus Neomarinimicrobiota bacterium]MCF7882299.1 ATP-binding protein [Candidatus Neomarinimicrobiota bacterium]